MKNFLRSVIIIISYLTTIPFWRRLFLAKPMLRIWCLHEVKDQDVAKFRNKLKYVSKKFNIITSEEFRNNDLSTEKNNLLITFDDGYESWLKNVLPVLDKFNIKAIFFIDQRFFSQSELLLKAGHSLGGHSVTHKRLTKLEDEVLEQEINNSINSDFFAYPYGDKQSYNNKVILKVGEADYHYGFTILPGFNTAKTNTMLLHRDSLDVNTNNLIFKLWLKGCYDLIKK